MYTISQTQWTLVTAHKKTHKLNKESEREREGGGGGERMLDTRDMARAGHHRHAQQHQCGLAASAGRKGAGESRKAAAAFCDWLRASGPDSPSQFGRIQGAAPERGGGSALPLHADGGGDDDRLALMQHRVARESADAA